MPFVKLATQSDLPAANQVKEFTCGNKMICIANVDGAISALDNVCLHLGGPLGEGVIEGGKVICPWHGWQYDPNTGQVGNNPDLRVTVYPIKIEDGAVMVEI